jgi:hypothetical protein
LTIELSTCDLHHVHMMLPLPMSVIPWMLSSTLIK